MSRPAVSQHLKALKKAGLVCDWVMGAIRPLAFGMQGFGLPAKVALCITDRDVLILDGDRGEGELVKTATGLDESCQVVNVQPLHDKNQDASLLIVQPAEERAAAWHVASVAVAHADTWVPRNRFAWELGSAAETHGRMLHIA